MIMFPVKVVKQSYLCGPEISGLLEVFRCMVNDCIQIGLAENVTSMKSLSLKAYHKLNKYPIYTQYRLTAISKAAGLLKNYRKALRKDTDVRVPYARRLNLVAYYGVKVQDGKLRLPIRAEGSGHPAMCISISLNPHVLRTLGGFRVRSVTLTDKALSVCYEKHVEQIAPRGFLGVDRNLNNATAASPALSPIQYDLSEATRIKSKYREVKRHMRRNDARIYKRVYGKYGRLQRDKVQQILHRASKLIVMEAKRNQCGIVMEKLTGIRKLYRRGNGQGSDYRSRMNGWSFAELQRQIEYKAEWEGLPVIYVNPYGTSAKCAKCGSRLQKSSKPEEHRTLECSVCGFTVDRDVNAALNLSAAGALRFGAVASPSEAMVSVYTPSVDGDELTDGGLT